MSHTVGKSTEEPVSLMLIKSVQPRIVESNTFKVLAPSSKVPTVLRTSFCGDPFLLGQQCLSDAKSEIISALRSTSVKESGTCRGNNLGSMNSS